ncbi:85/88 kDa calcium-independent phospholipase A2-like [Dermatophagoides pteronyssinus]|uniref:85/88 kDa calcium-independent phospholipase A2-like n=1 Tax=Dermatophagoides pteronyssinus TaxID=6956 RepID=UPI003F6640D9
MSNVLNNIKNGIGSYLSPLSQQSSSVQPTRMTTSNLNNNNNNKDSRINKYSSISYGEIEVIDSDNHEQLMQKNRLLLKNNQYVWLYEHQSPSMNNSYEIIYRINNQSFLVFHSMIKNDSIEYFEHLSSVLNNLSEYITKSTKVETFKNLKTIMDILCINPNWNSTHIAARLGFIQFFNNKRDIAVAEINSQIKPDEMTPLHLAIIHNHKAIIEIMLLDLYPNLNLLDSKQYSILHYAALSQLDIFRLILSQSNMLDRILWQNHQGSTALHLACFARNYSIVFEFLKFGLTVQMLTLNPPKNRLKTRKNKQNIKHRGKIVRFTDQDLGDIDCQDIEMVGSPLHWVKHRRLMEKLINVYKFELNIRNLNGETPLHVMVKRNRIRCVITLLCSGAKVDAKNKFGNTPLHRAIKADEITLSQALIVFDANINAINNRKESIRHLAALASSREQTFFSQHILYLVSSLGAQRCPENMINCNSGCSHDGNFEGRWNFALTELTNHYETIFNNLKNSNLFDEVMEKDDEGKIDEKCVNMLCLDGGGIRGLIIVQVMLEFQKRLERPFLDYFQWIIGTSTGSLVAAYLVSGKSLKEIRNIYFQFKDKVFVGDRPYDAGALECLIKEFLGPDLTMRDLKTKFGKNVIIPAVLYDRVPMKLHLFRSYPSHLELLKKLDYDQGFARHPNQDQLVWKACRASGAAPTYFNSFGPFIDGGIISNNPTIDALTEFEFNNNALNHIGRHEECEKLRFVLSLGTGRQQTEPCKPIDISKISLNLMELNTQIRYIYQMTNLLLYELCNTDNHIVKRAEAFCSAANILYFRINPQFNKLIELDETLDFKIINLLWETKRFMYLKRDEVEKLVKYLEKFAKFPKKDHRQNETENKSIVNPKKN